MFLQRLRKFLIKFKASKTKKSTKKDQPVPVVYTPQRRCSIMNRPVTEYIFENHFEVSSIPHLQSQGWQSSQPYSQNASHYQFRSNFRSSHYRFRSSRPQPETHADETPRRPVPIKPTRKVLFSSSRTPRRSHLQESDYGFSSSFESPALIN